MIDFHIEFQPSIYREMQLYTIPPTFLGRSHRSYHEGKNVSNEKNNFFTGQTAVNGSEKEAGENATFTPSTYMRAHEDPNHPSALTAMIVITSIFLFMTLTITGTVIVFCKKKNSVFAFQKSENDSESDFEMDEISRTDIDIQENDSEIGLPRHLATHPQLHDSESMSDTDISIHINGTLLFSKPRSFSCDTFEYDELTISTEVETTNRNQNEYTSCSDADFETDTLLLQDSEDDCPHMRRGVIQTDSTFMNLSLQIENFDIEGEINDVAGHDLGIHNDRLDINARHRTGSNDECSPGDIPDKSTTRQYSACKPSKQSSEDVIISHSQTVSPTPHSTENTSLQP